MIYLILLAITILLLYFHLTRNFSYWKKRKIPFVDPIPIFGNVFNAFTLKESVGEFLHKIYKTTTSAYLGFFIFDQPYLLIRSPDLIKTILIKDFDYFNDRTITENNRDDELGSNILFIVKNPAWKAIRTKLTPAFTSGKIKNMFPLMKEVATEMKTYINNLQLKPVEARELCGKYATDVISSCAFGINTHAFKYENAEFRVVARRIFSWSFSRAIQMASYFFAPMLVKPFRMTFIDPVASNFLKDAFWKTLIDRENSGAKRGDLIDILVHLRKTHDGVGFQLDGDKLVAQAGQFFVAGFETTGSTIAFALYELSLNPSIQNRVREEINTTLNKHETFSYEAIQDMKYLDMVLSETLRKYPLLPFLDRRCVKDYQIPGTDVVIEKGIPVYISLFGLHNDTDYFPSPEKFDPERFSDENKDSIPNCCYLPFGDGPHNCIGARFGLLSSKAALVHILTDFKVEPTESTPLCVKFDPKGITLAPQGKLNLCFKPL